MSFEGGHEWDYANGGRADQQENSRRVRVKEGVYQSFFDTERKSDCLRDRVRDPSAD